MYAWIASFLEKNPELTLRQDVRFSITGVREMNSQDTANIFNLLEHLLMKRNLMD